eukprot:9478465-Pyramimonas_sp.AAC.1
MGNPQELTGASPENPRKVWEIGQCFQRLTIFAAAAQPRPFGFARALGHSFSWKRHGGGFRNQK